MSSGRSRFEEEDRENVGCIHSTISWCYESFDSVKPAPPMTTAMLINSEVLYGSSAWTENLNGTVVKPATMALLSAQNRRLDWRNWGSRCVYKCR
jgi:hypothetical protein